MTPPQEEQAERMGMEELHALMKQACLEALQEFFRGGATETYYDLELAEVIDLVAECDSLDDLQDYRDMEINHPFHPGGRAGVFEVIRLRESELSESTS